MYQKFVRLFWVGMFLLLMAACVPLPAERPNPTATVMPTAAPVAQPTLSVFALHPPSTRTGIAEVDRVIEGMLGGSVETQRGLLLPLSFPCTTREGLGGPPKCNPGESEGTTVQAFPLGGPEGSFLRVGEIDRILPLQVAGLYAVYKVPADAYRADYWPAGEYGVAFLRSDRTLLIALVTADGIVRLDWASSPAVLAQQMGGEFVLAPAGS